MTCLRLWPLMIRALALAVLATAVAGTASSTPPEDDRLDRDYQDELPRIAPVEPEDALATFRLHRGLRIELVAAEPLVNDPVAVAFDASGRLYVVEMRGYSEQADENLGRVRGLEDTDADGRFDRATVFLDGLSWPTAVICYDGGVFVGAAPDILYAKDTDGDGRADHSETVFTGFGRSNVQGLLNSFRWGLDNRIHGATSSSGGDVRRADRPDEEPVRLRGRDFAFNPRTRELEATSGGAQHGMSFDDWGRKFVCSNSDHIQQVMFEDRYVARNPLLAVPGARRSIASDGPQSEVFRISPVEPWRIVRTRLRVKGLVKGPVEGGGRPAGYFTGATGVTIYRGDALGPKYRGNAFIGDVGSNIVHRKVLETDGIEFVADRADPQTEFLASSDIWFRPAQFANAPDGALYIVDVYREVIEHPDSLPPLIKKHLDLTSGRDRGRIYRVVAEDFQQPPLPMLDEGSAAELVAALESPIGWRRDTASRLLYERADRRAIEPLVGLVTGSRSPLARMHALCALDGLDALRPDVVLAALDDAHPRVRENAVRLAERAAADAPAVRDRLYAMTADDDVRVRYQLAFTLGEFAGSRRNRALAELARRDCDEQWMRLAVASSLAEGAGEVFALLVADAELRQRESGRVLLAELAAQVGAGGRDHEVAAVLNGLDGLSGGETELRTALVRGLSEGLARSDSGLKSALRSAGGGQLGSLLAEMLTDARRRAVDESLPAEVRIEAIRSLGLGSLSDSEALLRGLLDSRLPQAIQSAALAALDRMTDEGVGPLILEPWATYSPALRRQATEALFARGERLAALLDGIEAGSVTPRDFDAARVEMLRSHADAAIRTRAERLLSDVTSARRQDVVDAYRPALELEGDADRGREVFKRVCSTCHRLEGVGHEIGPSLATIQNRGAEAILLNVLDPNREVNPLYVNYVVITVDGRTLTGIIAAETATSITLKRAEEATDVVLRADIDELRSTQLSIMPEGVEKDVDLAQMADLIAYLNSIL